jgi:hypothetical protein
MKPAAETKLPPWQARNQRERDQMYEWVVGKLQEARANRKGIPLLDWFKSDAAAKWAASHDNMQPLRAKYPDLAPFLHPPERGRGKHQRPHPGDALLQAVEDVKSIKQIWKKYFPRKIRHAEDGLSALDIAARWHGFTRAKEIENLARRASKQSGPRTKKGL